MDDRRASTHLAAERLVAGDLRLDPLAATDAHELAPLLDDRRLHEFIGGEPLSEAELEARYRRLVQGAPPGTGAAWLNWTIRRGADGAAVGTAQATVTGGEAALAWVVASAWQGRGYATEAARALVAWARRNGLEPTANVHPQHAASERVASDAGLRPTDERAAGERVWRLPPRSDA
jgi:RimJ/RimL family protein N-acetyltransferase